MPTTPVYALPYPAPADAADVPVDMQELAERVELVSGELAYAQITANLNVTATSAAMAVTVVSAAAVTFEAAPIIVEFGAPALLTPNVAGGSLIVNLWDGGTDLGYVALLNPTPAGMYAPVSAKRRLTPTAGSHTYQIKAWIGPSGTGTVIAGAGGVGFTASPAFIRITRA